MSDVKDDITYLRNLAERGRQGTIFGGVFLAAAGLVFGIECILQWAVLAGHMPLAFGLNGYLWLAGFVVFALLFAILYASCNGAGMRKAAGAADIAFGLAWGGAALGISVSIGAIFIAGMKMNLPVMQFATAPVVFAFYGSAWFAAGGLSRRRWMYLVAIASFAASLLLAWMAGTYDQFLVMGGALLVTLTLPGIVLMREARG